MNIFRVYKFLAILLFSLVLTTNILVFFFWGNRNFTPPDTWEAIHFLKKKEFMNLRPGERARILFKGELIELKGVKLPTPNTKTNMNNAILISFQKTHLNETTKNVQLVFGIVDESGVARQFPMLLMNTLEEGKL